MTMARTHAGISSRGGLAAEEALSACRCQRQEPGAQRRNRPTNLTKLAGALCPRRLSCRLQQSFAWARLPWLDCLLVAAALSAACAFGPSTAAAQQGVIAGDGSYALPIKSDFAAPSSSFGLRLGRRIRLPSNLSETLELGLHYGQFPPGDTNTTTHNIQMFRGVLGARLGLAGIVRPGLFGHFGFGRVTGSVRSSGALTERFFSHNAFSWDAGVFLDFAVASFFEFGLHASYNQIFKAKDVYSFQWAEFGGHLQFLF
jgi:hypothetical protein